MWVWERKLYKNGCTNIISLYYIILVIYYPLSFQFFHLSFLYHLFIKSNFVKQLMIYFSQTKLITFICIGWCSLDQFWRKKISKYNDNKNKITIIQKNKITMIFGLPMYILFLVTFISKYYFFKYIEWLVYINCNIVQIHKSFNESKKGIFAYKYDRIK